MQAVRSAFFYLGENIFPFLRSKGSGLLFPAQGEPPWGLVGWEKIILASLRYFFPPSLVQETAIRYPAFVKSGKHTPMGSFT
mgnify:FL=1